MTAPAAELATLRDLALMLPGAATEAPLVERALDLLSKLVPDRGLCVRCLDVRTREPTRAYTRGARLREGIASEGVVLTEAALAAAKLKSAVAASARLTIRERWDSPFTGMATGFTAARAPGGELYGALDIGYLPGDDARVVDEPAAQMFASHLSVGLRTARLQEDAIGLRDYQARLLDSANALILGIDRGWRITVCNRALLELTGVGRDIVLGRDVRDFISADQRQHLTTAFAAALAGQHHSAVTIMLPTVKGGQVRSVWSIAPVGRVGQPGGPVEAVVAIGQDQSKIDALQQQVVRSERLATLGELAAGVVHELNNPLTSITVYAEYLVRKLEPGVDAADVEKLRRIGASAQRILRFSRDLVQYARPSGKDLELVDIAAVVRQSVSICEHLVERGGIALAVELDPELPPIRAVAGQLEQVLINLITNAVHAVENGGRVVVRATAPDANTLSLEVNDSGPGVPERDHDKIFEAFYTTKPDGKGTGLGLPIVRNIVEQHGGGISVGRSPALGGAAFRVVLPIV